MARRVKATIAIAVALSLPGVAAAGDEARTRRVSASPEGKAGNLQSMLCDVAPAGSTVAFDSLASNLVRSDTNGSSDVFVSDGPRHVERVSLTSRGRQARGFNENPSISATGRFVSFTSSTYDLAEPGNRNRRMTVFVHDRDTGRTARASDRSDGRRAFGHSYDSSISRSGRYVAFVSNAPDLAMKGDDNGVEDVFVHDRKTGKTNRVSLSRRLDDPNRDSSGPAISGNGRYVAYASAASNLVRRDRNDSVDVFVYDRVERRTDLVSVAADGSRSRDYSWAPSISADGRYVAFTSYASLAQTDAAPEDVYLHDRETGKTEHVSMGYRGAANGRSEHPAISDDGRYVAFVSAADNLVPGDTNGVSDVFVRDRAAQTTTRVSVGDEGQEANAASWAPPSLGPDGEFVCWSTAATNLDDTPDNHPDREDVFLRGPLF